VTPTVSQSFADSSPEAIVRVSLNLSLCLATGGFDFSVFHKLWMKKLIKNLITVYKNTTAKITSQWRHRYIKLVLIFVKTSLCGRDGRTICGPLRQPKSTYVTLAHKRKQKFFYFGCSLVRRFYCKITKLLPRTGRTDRQSATQYAAPSYGGGPHNKRNLVNSKLNGRKSFGSRI